MYFVSQVIVLALKTAKSAMRSRWRSWRSSVLEAIVTEERHLTRLSNVELEDIQWVWPGRLAEGAIANLSGDPGEAKSRITYDLAARVTTGLAMPGCSEGSPPAGVVLLQAEDHVHAVVKPTLAAAGANVDRIFVYDPKAFAGQPLALPDDWKLIEEAVDEVQAKLVVIDPVTAFFTCNQNSDRAVREALKPLLELAHTRKLAVLLVCHLNKQRSPNVLYKAAGSIAWVAASRAAMMAIPDPASSDPYRHLLVQTKTNLVSAPTLAYRTVLTGSQVTLEWLGTNGFGVKDLMGAGQAEGAKLWEAMEILFLILRYKPERAKDAIRRALHEGVARRTLDRAKAALRVKSERKQSEYFWSWQWRLPDEDSPLLSLLRQKYDALDAAVAPEHEESEQPVPTT